MPLPWPEFWQHIPEDDRPALTQILTELLSRGALLGDRPGSDAQLYLLARHYRREITDYFAPLQLEVIPDPDLPIYQLRPVPSDCGLVAKFNKAETLLLLTLWRIYHDTRMEQTVETVLVTADEIWKRLLLYFEKIEPPSPAHLREMLQKFRARRLVRLANADSANASFGDTQVEILPTLPRTIPFENPAAWEMQRALHTDAGEDATISNSNTDGTSEA